MMDAPAQPKQTKAIEAGVKAYADKLGLAVKDIPLDQHLAVMAACVAAVKAALDELAEECGE